MVIDAHTDPDVPPLPPHITFTQARHFLGSMRHGGSLFSPSAGRHAIEERSVARAGHVVNRPMMFLALTYDHRIVDGREAVLFLRRIREVIEEPARMLIEV